MGTECLQGHLWTENGKGLKKYPSPPAPQMESITAKASVGGEGAFWVWRSSGLLGVRSPWARGLVLLLR